MVFPSLASLLAAFGAEEEKKLLFLPFQMCFMKHLCIILLCSVVNIMLLPYSRVPYRSKHSSSSPGCAVGEQKTLRLNTCTRCLLVCEFKYFCNKF
jgi:hypothetical protein